MPGNEFNYNASYQSASGEMFFGGFNGFISFFPDRIKTNKYAAPIVFTGLKLLNQPVEINGADKVLSKNINLTKEINLDYNQDVFTIDFALLNYTKPAKNKYAYKLEGLDEGWTETNSTFVTYTHLSPGNYTLLVKGANNDGVWSKPASLKIKVLPPFWKTWWAYIIYVLLLFAIIFFVTRFFFLRELIKKEDALHQFKLNFFTNISHEIRTNLALILGPVEKLIYSSRNDAATGKQLTQIKKNAERLLKLVNEQMDFRKAETGNLKLHISKENIVAFVEEIYATFQNLALSKNIKTTFASDNDNIDMYFDRQQLEKVFFNILSNAYKFTQDGGEVDISIKEQRNTVEIKIVDNGKGISKENLPKLFNNFYQEDDTNTQNTGYGIGLALAKSIVQLHKGELIAESFIAEKPVKNKTAFTVKLPKGHNHFESNYIISHTPNIALKGDENAEIALPATIRETSLPQQELLTVLLVEDNAEVRSFISESLNTVYNLVESVNGLKGWEAATELIPDIIISDVMMPEMDGYTLCHRLKADERTSHIPIILLTAKSAAENYVSGLEMGADIYLTKPFSIRVLELHLRNLIITREKLQQYFNRRVETVSTPELPIKSAVIPNKIDEDFLNRAIQIVEDCMNDPDFGVNKFATKIAMSPPVLYKKLKAVTNMSVNDFIKSLRLQKAHQLIQNSEADIKDVAYMVGYKDSKYFVKEYKKRFNV